MVQPADCRCRRRCPGVAVVEGDRVAKGQVLVRLDDRDARLQLLQREAELRQAEARIAAEQLRHEANLETLPRERQSCWR